MRSSLINEHETGADTHSHGSGHGHRRLWPLVLGCLGVVYGDIGTSPLYAFRESLFALSHDGIPEKPAILGLLSLILWALILIVSFKYVAIVLRADNNGEGGTLSLMSLAQRGIGRRVPLILLLGTIGASLFYGDALITPAISVLSAVEGLKIAIPTISHQTIVLLTVGILTFLFLMQKHGTHRIATFFGPVTGFWFLTMGGLGVAQIIHHPDVLWCLNPLYAVTFLYEHRGIAFIVLGAVFLAVTGAEALYTDLGHFGRKPIQMAWFMLVLPCLVLNYMGQGALVLSDPLTRSDPFYLMVPEWALLPFVGLATLATIIASQAVITGAFSLSQQAVQLGMLPRMEIRHTSADQFGQIYMPQINIILFLGVVMLVLMFGSSSALASAYGLSVSGTMVVTGIMAFFVIWKHWKWSVWGALALLLPIMFVESVFVFSNILKMLQGGWVSLLIALIAFVTILTWMRGSRILSTKSRRAEVQLTDLIEQLEANPPVRVSGTAVFLTSSPETAPTALVQNLHHNKALHDKNIILTIMTADVPRVSERERVLIQQVSESFIRLIMTFGYMETPSVLRGLITCRKLGWPFELVGTSFFLSRRSVHAAPRSAMPRWQDHYFIMMARNARPATDFFEIPTDRAIEIGTRISV